MLVVGHLVEDLACEEVEPKPWGAQWGLGDEEGMVLGVGGPVGGVGGQGEGRNLEEGGLAVGVPLVAGQTDQGREQGEEACRRDLEDQQGEGEDPGQEVEVLEGLVDQVDREGAVGDPASHQGSVVVALQAQRDQESGLLQGQVVQETFLCLYPWENLHEGQRQGDQLYLPQTSGLTGYFCVTASQTG